MGDMMSASIIWIHSQKCYLYRWAYSISDELFANTIQTTGWIPC